MLNLTKIVALLVTLSGTLYAHDRAPENKSRDTIEIKDHCHAHLTRHGCLKRWSCYWDDYQNRCLYR